MHGDWRGLLIDHLVGIGYAILERPQRGVNGQRSAVLKRNLISAAVFQSDLFRIRSRLDMKLIFELVHRAIEDQIDSGPQFFVNHLGIGGNSRFPLLGPALEVVEPGDLFASSHRSHGGTGRHEIKFHHIALGYLPGGIQGKGNPRGGEIEGFVRALKIVGHLVV